MLKRGTVRRHATWQTTQNDTQCTVTHAIQLTRTQYPRTSKGIMTSKCNLSNKKARSASGRTRHTVYTRCAVKKKGKTTKKQVNYSVYYCYYYTRKRYDKQTWENCDNCTSGVRGGFFFMGTTETCSSFPVNLHGNKSVKLSAQRWHSRTLDGS